ncbi:site-specific integrase [Natronorubrum thiooxidans]|uniref:site-specific integrase n=1 Tax=Natronorubrum thiooxidans TaxID=308853 RepID=UPI00373FD74E
MYDRYLSRKENRSSATRAQYRRTIPSFIEFAEDNKVTTPLGISTELADRYVDTLQTQHDTDATILTYQ